MKTYHIKTEHFNEEGCIIEKRKYPNDRDALQIMCANGEPFITASTNLVDMPCEEGYCFVKDYSENEGLFLCLVELKVIEPQNSKTWAINRFGTVFPYVKILI